MAHSLEAKFGLDATGVKTGLKELKHSFSEFGSVALELLGVAGIVATFAELSKGAGELAKHITDASLNLGISAQAYQVLQFSAEEAGVSTEAFDKSLEKVRSKAIEAAAGNKEAAASFQKLGLNAAEIIKLPLEQQYSKIAEAVTNSADQTKAYSAIVALFGEKVAPKLMESLQRLGKEGFDKLSEDASHAGVVLEDSTIAALNRATIEIEKFKKQATVAVGEIIVNFRTGEGIQLLGLQFIKVGASFMGKLFDALNEVNNYVGSVFKGTFIGVANYFRDSLVESIKKSATLLNEVLPKSFQIDIKGLDALKSTGEGVADSIARAMADTHPTTFQKDAEEFWGKIVDDQQHVVNELNKVDFKEAADKLGEAGKRLQESAIKAAEEAAAVAERAAAAAAAKAKADATEAARAKALAAQEEAKTLREAAERAAKAMQDSIAKTAKDLEDAAAKAAATFDAAVKNLAAATGMMFDQATKSLNIIGAINGKTLAGLSDDALQSLIRQDKSKQQGLTQDTAFDFHDSREILRLQTEVMNAQKELDIRNNFRTDISGPGGANDPTVRDRYDPQIFEKLLQQFGPGAADTNNRIANGIDDLNKNLQKGVQTVLFGSTGLTS